jgi:hypothetical protein
MGNIITAQLTIEGIRPLLIHRFGSHSIPLEKQERSGVPGNDPEEWRDTYLVTEDDQLYLPPTYPFACLKEGAAYTKRGKSNLRKPVASTLQVTDPIILLEDRYIPSKLQLIEQGEIVDPLPPVYIDVSGVRNPGSGGRQIRYRVAAAPGWKCTIHLQWDRTVISRGEMEAVSLDAGKLVGLGDGRSIGFGRFQVLEFAVDAAPASDTEASTA